MIFNHNKFSVIPAITLEQPRLFCETWPVYLAGARSDINMIWICFRCTIHWKDGKNVTVTQMKKKQKNAKTGTTRMVTKSVQNDSFFNFFSPPDSKFDTLSVSVCSGPTSYDLSVCKGLRILFKMMDLYGKT